MRTIGIFLSSSLKHHAEREAFIDAFKEENTAEVTFKVYGHEINGDTSCVPGKSSQLAIDAEALTADVFICYMGDMVGNATIWELEQVLADRTRMRHVYPIIQPGLKVEFPADMKAHYTTREEFEKKKLEACGFYSTTLPALDGEHTTTGNIRAKVRNIAETLRNKTIVELTPKMLAYDKIIPNSQQSYRLGSKLGYYRRELDDQLDRELAEGTPVTMVWGTSLAGKTRAVTEALGALCGDTHIHVLKEAGRASVDALAEMSVGRQFSPELRNVFFIDEIDRYLEIPACRDRILDACRMAAENPGRVQVIATSIKPRKKLEELMNADESADDWFGQISYIEAKTMSREEARALIRKLLRGGIELTQKITDDMPIGALLIDLSRMKNVYSGSLKTIDDIDLVYDAVKTLWLWKSNSRGDSKALAEYIRDAYEDAGHITAGAIYDMIKNKPELFMIDGPKRNYTFDVDDLLVEEVFRFEVSGTREKAIERLIDYILGHDPRRFEGLAKLLARLAVRAGEEKTDEAMAYVLGKLDVKAEASGSHETETSASGGTIDWTERFIARIAERYAMQGKADEVRRICEAMPTHSVLAQLIRAEKPTGENRALLSILNPDGMPRPEYGESTDVMLHIELLRNLEFDKAMAHFERIDFNGIVNSNISSEVSEKEGREAIEGRNLKVAAITCGRKLAVRSRTLADVEKTLAAFNAVNGRLGGVLFESEGEKLFSVINIWSWKAIAGNIDRRDLLHLFERVRSVEYEREEQKAAVLTTLMRNMDESDCRVAWAALGPLQDSFSLGIVIDSSADFADAYGIVTEFQNSEHGKKVKINSVVLNNLLQKCSSRNDVNDCEDAFRRAGLIGDDERISDLDNDYTFGIYLNFSSKIIPEKSKLKFMEKHRLKKKAGPRNIKSLKCIVRPLSGYNDVWNELYGDKPKYVTKEEQAILRDNVEANSLLFRNANSGAEIKSALELLETIKKERGYLLTEGDHIISELVKEDRFFTRDKSGVKSGPFFKTFEETRRFYEELKREFPSLENNVRNECQLYERLISKNSEEAARPLELFNSLVIKHAKAEKFFLERLFRLRFFANMRKPFHKVQIGDWERKAPYPIISQDGSIRIEETTRVEYCRNLLAHGMILEETLALYLNYALGLDDGLRTFDATVEEASRQKAYVGQDWFINIRHKLPRGNDGAMLRLLSIAPQYSITCEVIDSLYNAKRNKKYRDKYTAADGIKAIEDFEARTGRRVFRSSALMAAIANRLKEDRYVTLEDIIAGLKELAPEGYRPDYIARQALLSKVKTSADLNVFYEYTPEPISRHEYSGLLVALRGIKEDDHRRYLADHALVLLECQEKKPGADVIMGLLCYHPDYNVERSIEYFAERGLEIPAEGAGYLFAQVRSTRDYDLARAAYRGPLQDTHMTMLFYTMYDRFRNLIVPRVFNQFKNGKYSAQWKAYELAEDGTDKLKESLDAMKQYCKDLRTGLVGEFTGFWGGIARRE